MLGLTAYAFVLGTAFFKSSLARAAGAITALAGVLFGVYLLVVQLVVIDALCQWCLASDLVLDALAVACILRLNPDWACGLLGRSVFRGRSTVGEKTQGEPSMATHPTYLDHQPESDSGAFFKVAALLLGIAVGVVGFFALMMWADAHDARTEANAAPAARPMDHAQMGAMPLNASRASSRRTRRHSPRRTRPTTRRSRPRPQARSRTST